MARDGLDVSELEDYAEWAARIGKNWPKKSKKMMRQSGTKLKRKTLQQIRIVNLGKITGNYRAGITRGKVYKKDGNTRIRVYSNSPHGHLIEDGHDVVRGGKLVGHVSGREVFAEAAEKFEEEFGKDCEDMIDEMIGEL